MLTSPVASTSRLAVRLIPRRFKSDDAFKPFASRTESKLPDNWLEMTPPRGERATARSPYSGRRSIEDRQATSNAIIEGLAHSTAIGARRPRPERRRGPSAAALRSARMFVAGGSAGTAGMTRARAMDNHDWQAKCPPAPPTSVLNGRGDFLPELDLAKPDTQLAIVPEETRDGVVSKSWWRITTPEEPLTTNEEAGDYERWTRSYFKTQAPRIDPQIPSWTEVLDRTLPRNRTMTLAQKRLFARTVEQLVEGNGVIKSMIGKSYVAPVRWPRKREAQVQQVGQERMPWRSNYTPLIAKNVT